MRTSAPTFVRLLLGLCLCLSLGAMGVRPVHAAEVQAGSQVPALRSVLALAAEVDRLQGDQARRAAAQKQDDAVEARESAEIERLKDAGPGVARDLDLQERLARAQARAVELSQKDRLLKSGATQLLAARQRLIRACDGALGDASAGLTSAQRLEILRVRAAQVEALAVPDQEARQGLPQATVRSAALATEAAPTQLDDPTALRERADLLRDSADKVRRELSRLSQRTEEIQRRRHLRERAAQVDTDLFAEQVSSRVAATPKGQVTNAPQGGGSTQVPAPGPANLAGPPLNNGTQPTGPTTTVSPPSRLGLDPATLDLLRRSDDTADPEVKLQAMRRAQGELLRLADQLGARATVLERRADELRKRK